jgi:hypothetical protein
VPIIVLKNRPEMHSQSRRRILEIRASGFFFFSIILLVMSTLFQGCDSSSTGACTAETMDYVGTWEGSMDASFPGGSVKGVYRATLNIDGEALTGDTFISTNPDGTQTTQGTVNECTLTFTVTDASCADFLLSGTGTLSSDHTTLAINTSGTVCGPEGKQTVSISATLTRSD